jgi:hypothetical protein
MSRRCSEQVAAALVKKLVMYAAIVEAKRKPTAAERRHALKIKTLKAIRDANWETDRNVND